MTTRNLDALFNPRSVAVIGASAREGAVGRVIFENLLTGFQGPVMAVNPHERFVLGQPAYADVGHLPQTPDLAVVITPPETVPGIIAELAARGTRGACVITAGFSGNPQALARRQAMLDAARPALLRILGPNCVGLQVPAIGLNGSFANGSATAGSLALVSQSGAVITTVLDWAQSRGIGFSHVVSLGDMADVDFGDMLDYLATSQDTTAILLYIEAVTNARKFMSAARAAARLKPVVVVKAGRHEAGARAAASHTGALAGSDAVYDAAFRRAGMLRVITLDELFEAVESLACARLPGGNRLAIVTNGGGLGVLAADALADAGGRLAELSPAVMEQLNSVLPATWSHGNPIDLIGDATDTRYAQTLDALASGPPADGLLVLHCPTAVTDPTSIARTVIETLPSRSVQTVMTSWIGGDSMRDARTLFQQRGIATFFTPEDAVRAFMHLANYQRNQQLLRHAPPSLPTGSPVDTTTARRLIDEALNAGTTWLDEHASKSLLAAYGIPVATTRVAASASEAGEIAAALGGRVVIKILSPDILHKTDVGGVALDIPAEAAGDEASAMLARVKSARPDATIKGFTVQTMVHRPHAVELLVGMLDDAQFGPALMFGHGGTAVEVINDKAMGLPPLNLELAADMIAHTRVSRLLAGYRDIPPADTAAAALALVRFSQLICDLPEIAEMEINPLLADANGIVALDARVRIARPDAGGDTRLCIRPYPSQLERTLTLDGGERVLVRPVLPEDEPAVATFLAAGTPGTGAFTDLDFPPGEDRLSAARLTQVDYDRQMVWVVTEPGTPGHTPVHGLLRLMEDPNRERANFSCLLLPGAEDAQRMQRLLTLVIDYAQQRQVRDLQASLRSTSSPAANLCTELGCRLTARDDGSILARLSPVSD
ncbi:MAG: acetate--CoA ligase family protein [Pseudomonadales bacterium]|nr:acetate--CoA ligase family protein [Pseudomonadales bacterium]